MFIHIHLHILLYFFGKQELISLINYRCWSEQIRKDDLGAIQFHKSCNLWRTKNCTSFGLIIHIPKQIPWHFTTDMPFYLPLIFFKTPSPAPPHLVKWRGEVCLHVIMATLDLHVIVTCFILRGRLSCLRESLKLSDDICTEEYCLKNLMLLIFSTKFVWK